MPYQPGESIRFRDVDGRGRHGEIVRVDSTTANEVQYLVCLERREKYISFTWVWARHVLGEYLAQLSLFEEMSR